MLDLWIASMSRSSASAGRAGVRRPSPRGARELDASGAVGEVLVAPFDLEGRFVCPALHDRVIAFEAPKLGSVPVAIGVAAGDSKVRPILGALRAGVVGTLVTDVETAEAVVELDAATRSPHAERAPR